MTTTDQCCLDVFQNTSSRNAQTENYTDDTLSTPQTINLIKSESSSATDSSTNSIQSAYKVNYEKDNGNKYQMLGANNSKESPNRQPTDILTLMPQIPIKESMSDCCNAYMQQRQNMWQLQQQLQLQQQQLQQKLQQQHAQKTHSVQQPYHSKLSALKPQRSHYQLRLQHKQEEYSQKFPIDDSNTRLENENSEPLPKVLNGFVADSNGGLTQANQRIRSALTNLNSSTFQFNILAALKHYICYCRDEFNAALSSTLKCRTLARGISKTLDLLQETSGHFNNVNEYMYCVCELIAIYTSSELIYAREFKDHKSQIADRILFIAHRFLSSVNEELTKENFLRMFTKIKKMYGEREIMTTLFRDFIPEEMLKGQKELPDKIYIQYIIIFYQWKELELTDGDQKNVIDFADSFMRPAYTLYYNGCYAQYLPPYKSYAHATRFILEHLRCFEDLRIASILDNRLGSELDELDMYSDELKFAGNEPSNCSGANSPKTHSIVSFVDSTIDDDSNDSYERKSLSFSSNRLQKLKRNAQYYSNEVAMRKCADSDSCEEVHISYRVNAGTCDSLPKNEIEQHRPYDAKCNMNTPLESYDSQYRNAGSGQGMPMDSIQHQQQQQQQYYPPSYKQPSQHEISNYQFTQNINSLTNTTAMQMNPEDEEYLHDLEDALNYDTVQTPELIMTIPVVAKTGEYHDCPPFQIDDSYDEEIKHVEKVLDRKSSFKSDRKAPLFEETVKKDEKKLNTTNKNEQLVGPSQQKSTVKKIRKKSIDMGHTQLEIAENSLKCSTDNTARKETTTKISKRVKFNEKPLGPTRSLNSASGVPLKPALSSCRIKSNRFHKITMRNVNKETKSLSDLRHQSHSDSSRNVVNNNKVVKNHGRSTVSTSISTSAISTSSSSTTRIPATAQKGATKSNKENSRTITNANESTEHIYLQATPGCHNLKDARLLKQSKNNSYNELTCLPNESAFVNRILERQRDEMRKKRLAVENQQNKLQVKSKLSSAMSLIVHKAVTKHEPIKNIHDNYNEKHSTAAVNMTNNATQTSTKKSNSFVPSAAAIRSSRSSVSKTNISPPFNSNVKSSMKSTTKSTPNITRRQSCMITKKQMKTEQKDSISIVPLQQTLQELLEEQRKFEEHKQWLQQKRQLNKL